MLYSLDDLRGFTIQTNSGSVGTISDFVFHEDEWVVRYIIVDLEGDDRHVLLSPRSIDRVSEDDMVISTSASAEHILRSPNIEAGLPISRQLEMDVHDVFEWPYYWEDEKVIPTTSEGDLTAVPLAEMEVDLERKQAALSGEDHATLTRLHRFSRAAGFELLDRNQMPAGRIADFIVDDGRWNIFYSIVDAGGRRVLVSPSLINHIDWEGDEGYVDLDQETVASSPEFELEDLRREAGGQSV